MAQIDLKAPVEALEEHIQMIDEKVQELRQEQLEIHAVIDQKNAMEAAQRRVENLSDVERAALEQSLKAIGVETAEKIGTPGS